MIKITSLNETDETTVAKGQGTLSTIYLPMHKFCVSLNT